MNKAPLVVGIAAVLLVLWLDGRTDQQVFDVRRYGAHGDGLADDATAIAAALLALKKSEAAIRTLYFPPGTYLVKTSHAPSSWGPHVTPAAFPFAGKTSAFALDGIGRMEVKGAGKSQSIIQIAIPRTLFDAYLGPQDALELTVKDLSFKYSGGWNTSSNCTAILLGSAHIRNARMIGCAFYDFTTAIYGSGASAILRIQDCEFYYRHGRASIAQADPSFQFPCVAILEGAKSAVIERCRFDGLVDPTFSGLDGSIDPSQKCALDGFFAANHSGVDVIVRENTIRNNNIEGIHLLRATGKTTTVVEDNTVIGALAHSDFYYGIRGGVVSHRPAIIRRNVIRQQGGLAYGGVHLDLSGSSAADQESRIEENTISDCWNGIVVVGGTAQTMIGNNTVRGWAEYPSAEIEAGFGAARIGIHLIDCRDVLVKGNLVDGGAREGWWYRASSVSSQTGATINTVTRVYVADPGVFSVGAQINLRKKVHDGQSDRIATITALGPNYIDLDAAWATTSQLGLNAAAGDLIVSYKPGVPLDATRIGAIHAFNSTGTRAVENRIRNFTRAFNPSDLGSGENFIEMDSVDE